MNVGRSALWLSTACAALVLSARAGASVGSSEAVPLATGLVFTTTSHAGLATTVDNIGGKRTRARQQHQSLQRVRTFQRHRRFCRF
jgi:hypothetical protein